MLFSTNSAIAFKGLLCESAMIRIAFQSSPILSLPRSAALLCRAFIDFDPRTTGPSLELRDTYRSSSFTMSSCLATTRRWYDGRLPLTERYNRSRLHNPIDISAVGRDKQTLVYERERVIGRV